MTAQTVTAVFDSTGLFLGTGIATPEGGSTHDVGIDAIDDGALPRQAHWTGSRVGIGRPSGPPTAAMISAHTYSVLDLMNVTWLANPIPNQATRLRIDTNDRWKNTIAWIAGAHIACLRMLDGGAATNADRAAAFHAYQTLIPAHADSIAFWYRNHSSDVWTAYRTPIAGNTDYYRAYFGWKPGDPLPPFASDAAAATAWDGNQGTLDSQVPVNWANPDNP